MRATPLVLVVEDDDDTRLLYSEYLSSLGYTVRASADGGAAVRAVLAEQPDLVVTDIALPSQSGFDLVAALRGDERTRRLPIVALSGLVQARVVEQARQAGCDAFLLKPCPLDRLLGEIERLLGFPAPRRSVLMVEDDPELGEMMAEVLRGAGYAVECAPDGVTALERLKERCPPRAIILDLNLLATDGRSLYTALRGDPNMSTIPLVVMTEMAPPVENGEQPTARAYLTKPVAAPSLIEAVTNC
jgi:CheY-like chemotaxis protein